MSEEKSGADLAREALAQAKRDARERGVTPGKRKRRGGRKDPGAGSGRGGDPQDFKSAIENLMASRGWSERAAVGGVFGRWPQIVGPELAEHAIPKSFEDGVLTVATDSNTWATQLRLLAPQLVKRLNEDLGHGTVKRVKVQGPANPVRRSGPLRASPGGTRPPGH